jgi:hypothetical protein
MFCTGFVINVFPVIKFGLSNHTPPTPTPAALLHNSVKIDPHLPLSSILTLLLGYAKQKKRWKKFIFIFAHILRITKPKFTSLNFV